MDNKYLVQAIRKLKPDSEFAITNYDYSTVKWNVLQGKAPTQVEIDAAIKQIQADELTETTNKATAKATAQAKLAALGLTVADLEALGL